MRTCLNCGHTYPDAESESGCNMCPNCRNARDLGASYGKDMFDTLTAIAKGEYTEGEEQGMARDAIAKVQQEFASDLLAKVKRNVSRDRQKRILKMLEEAALEEPEKAPVLRKIKGEIRDLFRNIGDAFGKKEDQ